MVVDIGLTVVTESLGFVSPVVGNQLYVFPPLANITALLPKHTLSFGLVVAIAFGITVICTVRELTQVFDAVPVAPSTVYVIDEVGVLMTLAVLLLFKKVFGVQV